MRSLVLAAVIATGIVVSGHAAFRDARSDTVSDVGETVVLCEEGVESNCEREVARQSEIEALHTGFVLGHAHEAALREVDCRVIATEMRGRLGSTPALLRPALEELAGTIERAGNPHEAAEAISAHVIALTRTFAVGGDSGGAASAAVHDLNLWSGTWETTYGPMVLSSDGSDDIVGYYGSLEHEIRGRLVGPDKRVLEGTWREGNSTGLFRFEMSDVSNWSGMWTGASDSTDFDWSGTVNWTGSRAADRTKLTRWAGSWSSSYGEVTFVVSEDGKTVQGSYGSSGHTIVGWVDPANPEALIGYWQHRGSDWCGLFAFEMNDRGGWAGAWSSGSVLPTGVNWTGRRGTHDESDSPGRDAIEGDVVHGDLSESDAEPAYDGVREAGSVAAEGVGLFLGEE